MFQSWHDLLQRLRSYCWETASPSLIYPEIFRAPCRKNYALDRKMTDIPTLNLYRTLLAVKSQLRGHLRRPLSPRKFAKMWCLFFLSCSESARCAFEGCIVWTIIASRCMDQFWCRFQSFFQNGSPFRSYTQFSFSSLMVPQYLRNCGLKLRKVQKSAEKFLRTTSYR